MDCGEARISLGVYVLGAIEPAERALVDSHLATCRDCRDELAGLAGLPALLARVSTEEAMALAAGDDGFGGATDAGFFPGFPGGPFPGGPQLRGSAGPRGDSGIGEALEPPRELLATVLDLTAARQRRRRWREAGLGVAAALVIAAGVFGGLRLASSPAPATAAIAPWPGPPKGAWEMATGQSGSTSAAVTYRPMGWGTELAAKVAGIPVGTHCQLWVIAATGQRTLVGSWVTDNNEGTVWYPASAALAAQDVAGFQITVGKGTPISIIA
jgi:hypothetical protein